MRDAKDPDPGWLDRFAEFLKHPGRHRAPGRDRLHRADPGTEGAGADRAGDHRGAVLHPGVLVALATSAAKMFVLAMLLFIMGLVLIGMEIFVLPGFGACGIFGILCMLAGLGLVTLEKIPRDRRPSGATSVGEMSQYMFAMMGALWLAFSSPDSCRSALREPDDARRRRQAARRRPRTAAGRQRGGGVARRGRHDEHRRSPRRAWSGSATSSWTWSPTAGSFPPAPASR